MPDITTSYMGLKLSNPIIVGSCDLTRSTSGILRLAEAGAGAVVLKSIFEEQFLLKEEALGEEYNIYPEALDYLRGGGLLEYGAQKICQVIEEAKKQTDIPLIASINCQSAKLWPSYARQVQEAGADGIELNIYFLPLQLTIPGTEYEEFHLQILRKVKKSVTIPVAVKLSSQLTSIPFLANKLADEGCDALIFFNWFLQPDIDVKHLKTKNIIGQGDFRQSLRWVALLSDRVSSDIASSGGLRTADDLVKQILAGAKAAQAATLFYQRGLKAIREIQKGLEAWMDDHHYSAVEDFRGELSFKKQKLTFRDMGEAESYFRAQYLKTYKRFE